MSEKKLFLLPDLGEGLPDAEIVEWHVKVGEVVKLDEPLVSMETAKAVVDVPSPYTGSPSKGMPIPEAEWTLSWWVRPVTGRNSTSARAPDSATTRHWVSAGLPFFAGIIRQPSAALLILASASSIVPCFASGIPARMPR